MSKKVHFKLRKKAVYFAVAVVFLASLMITILGVWLFFQNRFLPGTQIAGVAVGLTKASEAKDILEDTFKEAVVAVDLTVNSEKQTHSAPLRDFGIEIDASRSVTEALKRQNVKNLFKPNNSNLEIASDNEKLSTKIAQIASSVSNPPQDPGLVFDGQVVVTPAKVGYFLDQEKLKKDLLTMIQKGEFSVRANAKLVDPKLSEAQEKEFVLRGSRIYSKKIILTYKDVEFKYGGQELLNILKPQGGYELNLLAPSFEDLKTALNTRPTNPVFSFLPNENGGKGRVEEFSPAKDGLTLNEDDLRNKLYASLSELENTQTQEVEIEIPFTKTPPEFNTSDVNDLGINVLLGEGESHFRGSISSRVHNISLAASRVNGTLIEPGETFSFTKTLGDISVYSGYQQAYVIQGNQTVLGDGGGVCQVSTTFFRAALAAGLPIVERHAHSYRVGYYEQGSPAGIDATIYSPSVDIKVRNDTPGHILIQTFIDTNTATLRFELYGTSDGRVATIGKPVISQVVSPPEDLYIDDASLPAGQIKQIDYKAWGAKVSFNYSVERNGEIIFEDTFYSNYRPWQAKFLRGTGPVQ